MINTVNIIKNTLCAYLKQSQWNDNILELIGEEPEPICREILQTFLNLINNLPNKDNDEALTLWKQRISDAYLKALEHVKLNAYFQPSLEEVTGLPLAWHHYTSLQLLPASPHLSCKATVFQPKPYSAQQLSVLLIGTTEQERLMEDFIAKHIMPPQYLSSKKNLSANITINRPLIPYSAAPADIHHPQPPNIIIFFAENEPSLQSFLGQFNRESNEGTMFLIAEKQEHKKTSTFHLSLRFSSLSGQTIYIENRGPGYITIEQTTRHHEVAQLLSTFYQKYQEALKPLFNPTISFGKSG